MNQIHAVILRIWDKFQHIYQFSPPIILINGGILIQFHQVTKFTSRKIYRLGEKFSTYQNYYVLKWVQALVLQVVIAGSEVY